MAPRTSSANRRAFGQRLDAALEQSPKNREQLAQHLGVHVNTIGNWIRGDHDCPVAWVPDIASALSVSLQDLIGGSTPTASAGAPSSRPAASVPATPAPVRPIDDFVRRVAAVLEQPLTAPDLMGLLAEAKTRLEE
jgi:hypothetical protein